MSALDFRLLNEFQRDFPLCAEPYREIAARLGAPAAQVMAALARLRGAGAVSRVGAVFRPGAVGASTLAAMAVPPERLVSAARAVNGFAGVNHNYEREHRLNLWFVAAAADARSLARLLRDIESATGIEVLSLPLIEEYHIDLGFDLAGNGAPRAPASRRPRRIALDAGRRRLVAALQDGLAPVARPYAELAARARLGEAETIAQLRRWIEGGVIRRFGVIVRHLELGWGANAMCVWDVPDAQARSLGGCVAKRPEVTLCYLRERRPPHWPHNFYCMIHGRERGEVEQALARLRRECGLEQFRGEVLFSSRRFKQNGARPLDAVTAPQERA